jgi:hypothetical protein
VKRMCRMPPDTGGILHCELINRPRQTTPRTDSGCAYLALVAGIAPVASHVAKVPTGVISANAIAQAKASAPLTAKVQKARPHDTEAADMSSAMPNAVGDTEPAPTPDGTGAASVAARETSLA